MKDIQQVITKIQTKIGGMHTALQNVKAENNALKLEVERLTDKLLQRENEVKDFKDKYDVLMQQYEEALSRSTVEAVNNDAHIDALVREIDECINRLKAE